MDALLENAQRIFDVANSAADDSKEDFALFIRPDGGLHLVMGCEFTIEASAAHTGAATAYRITRSREGVRVEGRSAGRGCVIEEHDVAREVRKMLFPNQALYRITSPLLTSTASLS